MDEREAAIELITQQRETIYDLIKICQSLQRKLYYTAAISLALGYIMGKII